MAFQYCPQSLQNNFDRSYIWHRVYLMYLLSITILCKHSMIKFDPSILIRSCEEESKARMGVVECLNHKLVEPFNVLYEKDGEHQLETVTHPHQG